ncbi:MAG: DUF3160 domain-containing protein [Bacteroidales bacterium]|nr:DUF3160 domain-containing protein [Bacteroidales bacterium]
MEIKKYLIFLGLIPLAITSCDSKQNPSGQNNENSSANVEVIPVDKSVLVDDSEFFYSETKLPQSIDFNMDLSNLTYQQLRVYQAYPYAIHGFWFKDMQLNLFFTNRTDWYYDQALEYYGQFDNDPNYFDLWSSNQAEALKKVSLTADEQKFVENVTAKMAELEKNKTINSNNLKINNLALAINRYQINNGKPIDNKLAQLLSQYNIAFETSQNDQLFQIYEDNDYKVMPSFVTTDLYLQAYHMYFSYILKSLENNEFTSKLTIFMNAMYNESMRYAKSGKTQNEKELGEFVATFFAIGNKVLTNNDLAVPQKYQSQYTAEINSINNAKDASSSFLQTKVDFNYSLFKPRGHYTRNEKAKAYFKCMMWLQTAYFELDNEEAVKKSIAMAKIFNNIDQNSRNACMDVYNMLTFLMGIPDNVAIIEMSDYISNQFGNADIEELIAGDKLNNIKNWIKETSEKGNKITPKIAVSCPEKINFMPQRYEPDNQVLNQMGDETANSDRAYPKGVDVFDAFGIKSAKALLDTFYTDSKSWKNFDETRSKMNGLFNDFKDWNSTSYNKWIESLMVLQNTEKNYPDFMKTNAYQLKNLNTALASWAELKHDAILYAEQPMMAECGGGEELPEPVLVGLIEPNLAFWNKLLESINHLENILKTNNVLNEDLISKNENLKEKVQFCINITKKELNGEKLDNDEYSTIRTIGSSMEYFTLSVLDPDQQVDSWGFVQGADKSVAVVCDVFTRNVTGCQKNGILYEATGTPNIIYALVEIEGKLYITRGATFSYYEFVRPLGDRLTDEQWQEMIQKKEQPSQPEWFKPLMIDNNIELNETFLYSSGC